MIRDFSMHVTDTSQLSLADLQDAVGFWYLSNGFQTVSAPTIALIVGEEAGEVAKATLLTETPDYKRVPGKNYEGDADIAMECGDVITAALALCNKLGIQPKFKWAKPHVS